MPGSTASVTCFRVACSVPTATPCERRQARSSPNQWRMRFDSAGLRTSWLASSGIVSARLGSFEAAVVPPQPESAAIAPAAAAPLILA